jgi:hypothetical protein
MGYVGSRVFVILMLAASMGANFVEVQPTGDREGSRSNVSDLVYDWPIRVSKQLPIRLERISRPF